MIPTTLVLLIVFIAIVVWAFSKKRKARFDADARIPFKDDGGSR